jgi:hypothetical protein
MTDSALTLDEAVIGAGEAPPSVRIEFRDAIARHGPDGIARVAPWLTDPKMAAFAVRVIARAAEFGAAEDARGALELAFIDIPEPARSDAAAVLGKLGSRKRQISRGTTKQKPAVSPAEYVRLDQLVEDRVYRRVDLHTSGLGGNRQKGISYPADGTHVLLFSDPDSVAEWGYRDTWLGPDTYRYYGEWDGSRDMLMRGGNLAIVARSREIYLFVKAPGGHRYAGKFECVSRESVPTAREGREFLAIVFTLRRTKAPSG